ncbi:MAG: class IV adenylate cyclase [Spirochaetota bacterium]
MLEIEIKAYCDSHNAVIAKIKSLGGTLVKTVKERDTYYKHPARNFAETDEAFRIRTEDGKNILTYKGPKLGTKTKTRVEKEAGFDDLAAMKEILGSLGFAVVDEVAKTRTIYRIGDTEVCLDSIDGLGAFVELEKLGTDMEVEKELFDLAAKLGLSRFETKSYLELKLEKAGK